MPTTLQYTQFVGVSSQTGRAHGELQRRHHSPQLLCVAAEPKRPGRQPSLSPRHRAPHHQVRTHLISIKPQENPPLQKGVTSLCVFLFFSSREDICRAKDKCDTLGKLFAFSLHKYLHLKSPFQLTFHSVSHSS